MNRKIKNRVTRKIKKLRIKMHINKKIIQEIPQMIKSKIITINWKIAGKMMMMKFNKRKGLNKIRIQPIICNKPIKIIISHTPQVIMVNTEIMIIMIAIMIAI